MTCSELNSTLGTTRLGHKLKYMKEITTYEHSVLQNFPSTLEDRDDMNLCSL